MNEQTSNPQRTVLVAPDADAAADQAADWFCETMANAVSERGRATVALAGGSTPEALYARLARSPWREKLLWDKLLFFFGDERFVPSDDPEGRSNYGMAQRVLFDPLGDVLPLANVFPIPTGGGRSLSDAVTDYANTLGTVFQTTDITDPPRFDLILLGLGDDGHTASLFPGKPSLTVESSWVTGTPPGVLPPPVDRVTLTFPVLNAARRVLFLVTGAPKAEIVRCVLAAGPGERNALPASGVAPRNGDVTFLLDRAAAGEE